MAWTNILSSYLFEDLATPLSELCISANEHQEEIEITQTLFTTKNGNKTKPVPADFSGMLPSEIATIRSELQTAITTLATTYSIKYYIDGFAAFSGSAMALATALGKGSYGSSWLTTTDKEDFGTVLKQMQDVLDEYRYIQWFLDGPISYTKRELTTDNYAALCAGGGTISSAGPVDLNGTNIRGAQWYKDNATPFNRTVYNVTHTIDAGTPVGVSKKVSIKLTTGYAYIASGQNKSAFWTVSGFGGGSISFPELTAFTLARTEIITATSFIGSNRTLTLSVTNGCPNPFTIATGQYYCHLTYHTNVGGLSSNWANVSKCIMDVDGEFTY